jgi:uncharacterized protein (TIGR03083 family)
MSDPSGVIAALRASHNRLAALAESLAPGQETAQAYPADWTIAQVFSHLGSGAEIFDLNFTAGLTGAPAPGREANPPIWDRWNAKSAADQVRDAVATDRTLVEKLEALTPQQLVELRFPSFMGEVDVDAGVRLRLSEHALHTWDIGVALDPSAVVEPAAVSYVVDSLGRVAGWSGKANGLQTSVRVTTSDPARVFTLTFEGDKVSLASGGEERVAATLKLPAEAFTRLVYGRLDVAHTPSLAVDGIELDTLREAFPGF